MEEQQTANHKRRRKKKHFETRVNQNKKKQESESTGGFPGDLRPLGRGGRDQTAPQGAPPSKIGGRVSREAIVRFVENAETMSPAHKMNGTTR